MSVKRYSVWEDEMFEEKHAINSTNGMVHLMVKHEDYAALEQKLAESQREFRAADATIENLQMQVEKLSAENAGMKATAILLADEANQVYRRWNLIQQPDGDIVDMQTIHELLCACHETPAADAFLAEVRAQGVEMFAAWNDKHIKKGVEHKESLTAVSHAARGFAALLRKGVQP
ncbi:hypothetical protein ABKU80_09400 [Enterobacter mori]|uniref:hypothetical protein n=1 Tax=Enterobacter mori TaxID=539813 RepID=UPI0032AEFF70